MMNTLIISVLCALAATAFGEINSRIVGGSNANIADHNYQCSLQKLSGSSYSHTCGCVLFQENKAVTAAHCLSGNANTYRIVVGTSQHASSSATNRVLSSYTLHQRYNDGSGTFANDVALLRWSQSLSWSSNIGPVTLASNPNELFTGTSCTVTGWGRTNIGSSLPSTLQKGSMTAISRSECSSRMSSIGGTNVIDSHICVYDSGNQVSACNGDSGGPVVCNNQLAGVASWVIRSGTNCLATYPSVYTRISSFYNWIVTS